MSYRKDLVTKLTATPNIHTKVQGRYFFGEAPIEEPYPLIVFFSYTGRPVSAKGSQVKTDDTTVQIEIISDDLDEVEQLSADLLTALDRQSFGKCYHCLHLRTVDDFDSESKTYRIIQDYQFWQRR